jgi:hypothetical protein
MVKAGVNKVYRDLILGHSLQGLDLNYIVENGLEDEMRQAMNQYAEWLEARMKSELGQQNGQQTAETTPRFPWFYLDSSKRVGG